MWDVTFCSQPSGKPKPRNPQLNQTLVPVEGVDVLHPQLPTPKFLNPNPKPLTLNLSGIGVKFLEFKGVRMLNPNP